MATSAPLIMQICSCSAQIFDYFFPPILPGLFFVIRHGGEMGSEGRGAFFRSGFIFVLSRVLPFGLSWLLWAWYSSTYILPFINEKLKVKKWLNFFWGQIGTVRTAYLQYIYFLSRQSESIQLFISNHEKYLNLIPFWGSANLFPRDKKVLSSAFIYFHRPVEPKH